MFRSILVPLDGSKSAEHALPWALSIAQQDGVALHIVRVHIPAAPIMLGSELAADLSLEQTLQRNELEYLETTATGLRKVATVPVHHALLEGPAAEAIDEYTAARGADLIVMTSHGHSPFVRMWLGSVADRVIRHSHIPVLLVRPHQEQATDLTARPFIPHIIITLDGSALAEQIIPPALKLGRTTGADFELLMAIECPASRLDPAPETVGDAVHARALTYLTLMARRLEKDARVVHCKVVEASSEVEGILDYVARRGNPLVALATHGRSGLQRLVLGSIADKIIRGTGGPVLILHPLE